jgi:small subunit ribosomal protein S6
LRDYESIFIINPGADENSINKLVDETQNFIKSNGYNVKKVELWGKKRLAYNVEDYDDGFFIFLLFESDPNFIAQLTRFYQLSESIIKYATVRSYSKASKAKPISATEQPIRNTKISEEDEEDEEDNDN